MSNEGQNKINEIKFKIHKLNKQIHGSTSLPPKDKKDGKSENQERRKGKRKKEKEKEREREREQTSSDKKK